MTNANVTSEYPRLCLCVIVGKNSSEALPLDNRPFNSFFNFRRGQVKKRENLSTALERASAL